MPIYCEMKAESTGEIFSKCGTSKVAGRNANTNIGDDFTLVKNYGYSTISDGAEQSSHNSEVTTQFNLTLPAYSPARAAILNVVNGNDKIEKLELIETDGRSVTGIITAEHGYIVSHSVRRSHDDNDHGVLLVSILFEKVSYDDKVTNTSGVIKTSSGGY